MYQGRICFTIGQTTVAVDARNCRELWRHECKLQGPAVSLVNRGAAIQSGRLFRGTADGHLIALSMADGRLLWDRPITSAADSHYLSMPAMVVGDAIVYGAAGADWGGRGWIGELAAERCAGAWRGELLDAGGGGPPTQHRCRLRASSSPTTCTTGT